MGEYVPDLIAFGQVVVDTKTIERITDHERGQMLNYLRVTRLPVGLLLNFRRARLEWERLVLTETSQPSASVGGRLGAVRRQPRMNADEREDAARFSPGRRPKHDWCPLVFIRGLCLALLAARDCVTILMRTGVSEVLRCEPG